ncbi:UDP-3-O-acyl-N-acetylglucosamine deacetylase [Tumidithrix elongata RA019]|uniref:UDP-3-O-acyl-N-acetylglucosamine deacetylase n=1 Tax=Tumidithrix elongata BACA0141 TaxID=2716417 RepID=A0AAW9PUJ5_9CYAN|nr:UDP-3-O-acyl-N-acetylglucosamine deacetylase [Tumidithrix elongata RA019]
MANQQTIAAPFSLSGIGLHTGEATSVRVLPSPPDTGRYFVHDGHSIPALVSTVSPTQLSTELKTATGASVRTVEHLLAALFGMGIDNARIELDRPEVPILDGSALPWVEAIALVGIESQTVSSPIFKPLSQTISVQHGDGFVVALPANSLRFTYGIEFDTEAIGKQWFSWAPSATNFFAEFAREIAPARTFTLAQYIEPMRAAGLIKGGNLENAIVCDRDRWLNPPLRFQDEPCRHKLLDLIGDLSLLGFLPQAHILAFKASHTLHTQFAQAIWTACK